MNNVCVSLVLAVVAGTSIVGCGSSSGSGLDNNGTAGTVGTAGTSSSSGGGSNGTGGGSSSTCSSSGTPAKACDAIVLAQNKSVASTNTDQFTWQDSGCKARTASLARAQGCWARQFSYLAGGAPRTVTGTGVNGWTGFGFVVTHYGGGAAVSQGVTSQSSALLSGRHHAIYRFKYNHNIGGKNVPVTVDWFFATGRDNPVYAITYDASKNPAGSIGADTRAPYGDMSWQGDGGTATVSGVAWGDHYKFVTTKAPLTDNSTWDYSKPNTIPYTTEWETSPDAEMGIVETQTYKQKDGGSAWFYGAWGKTSSNYTPPDKNAQPNLMPASWNWPYQMNNYELCFPDATGCANNTTGSHRLAWGTNYGAIGGSDSSGKYQAFGDFSTPGTLLGYPYQSYSVYVVLGQHSDDPIGKQVTQVETVQQTKLTASTGTVDTQGVGGVGRTDKITLAPVGYDHRYGVWSVTAAGDAVKLSTAVGSGTLNDPILVVNGYSKSTPPSVSVDGCTGAADADYFMSLDTANKQVWITFRNGWTGTQTIEVK